MKRGITVLAVAAAAVGCTLSAGASTSPTALPRVTRTSLLYVGAFRLPAPTSDRHTFAYGGTALAYGPEHCDRCQHHRECREPRHPPTRAKNRE